MHVEMTQYLRTKVIGSHVNLKSRHKFPNPVNNSRKSRLIYTNSVMSAIELSFNDMEKNTFGCESY